MKYIKNKQIIIGIIIAVVVALGCLSPTIIKKTKHSLKVHKIESQKKSFLEEIEKQAKEGKMIKSPFKLGESSVKVTKKWGNADTFDEK
ncbi:DUF4309 domain-containing protein, partial [Bacillus sp. JJ664]